MMMQQIEATEPGIHPPATSTSADNPVPAASIPRRRTTQLEEGSQLRQQALEEALLAALGKNVAAHGDDFIDFVTCVSVLTVVLKLASSSLPRGIQAVAWR
jgi:hypothetical protein